MIYSFKEIQRRVAPLIKKYGIPALYLFGSYARGEATDDSDMDGFSGRHDRDRTYLAAGLGALYCDLEDTFGKAIDLITVSSIMQSSTEESDSDFKATVLKERVKLNAIA